MKRNKRKFFETLTLPKVCRDLEAITSELNVSFVTSGFVTIGDNDSDKKQLMFNDVVLFEIDRSQKNFPGDYYNIKTMKRIILDKIESSIYHKKIKPFSPKNKGQKVVVTGKSTLSGFKGQIIEYKTHSDTCKVFINEIGEIELYKEILVVIA